MDLASDPLSAAWGLALLIALAGACFVLPEALEDDQGDPTGGIQHEPTHKQPSARTARSHGGADPGGGVVERLSLEGSF